MNFIDKTVAFFNPQKGLERTLYRNMIADAENKYRQLKWTSRHKNLETEMGSEDQEIDEYDRIKITSTMRYFFSENPMVQGIIETIKDNTCGPDGPALQIQTKNESVNNKIETWWRDYSNECEGRGLLNFGEIIRMNCQDQVLVGDMGNIFSNGKIILVETDRISTPPEQAGNDNIVHGVLLQKPLGIHSGYYVGSRGKGIGQIQKHKYISAENFYLHMRLHRADSNRGRSELFPNIENLYDLDEYLQAEKMAAKFAAIFVIKKTTKNSNSDNPNGFFGKGGSSASSTTDSSFEDKFSRIKVGSAIASTLREGEDISVVENKRPGAQFTPYVEMLSRLIGVGVRLPIELVLLDYKNASFSSIRAAFNEAQRNFKARQSNLKKLCTWIFKKRLNLALVSGELSIPQEYLPLPIEWQFPGWEFINPKEEIEAAKLAIDYEISNAKIECARLGRDERTVAAQRKKELDYKKANEIPVTIGSPGVTILNIPELQKEQVNTLP